MSLTSFCIHFPVFQENGDLLRSQPEKVWEPYQIKACRHWRNHHHCLVSLVFCGLSLQLWAAPVPFASGGNGWQNAQAPGDSDSRMLQAHVRCKPALSWLRFGHGSAQLGSPRRLPGGPECEKPMKINMVRGWCVRWLFTLTFLASLNMTIHGSVNRKTS